jgi:very-short-patch-repair endonuclease
VFIADFYCAEHRLVVEIDGDVHDLQIEQDQERTWQFEE